MEDLYKRVEIRLRAEQATECRRSHSPAVERPSHDCRYQYVAYGLEPKNSHVCKQAEQQLKPNGASVPRSRHTGRVQHVHRARHFSGRVNAQAALMLDDGMRLYQVGLVSESSTRIREVDVVLNVSVTRTSKDNTGLLVSAEPAFVHHATCVGSC